MSALCRSFSMVLMHHQIVKVSQFKYRVIKLMMVPQYSREFQYLRRSTEVYSIQICTLNKYAAETVNARTVIKKNFLGRFFFFCTFQV